MPVRASAAQAQPGMLFRERQERTVDAGSPRVLGSIPLAMVL